MNAEVIHKTSDVYGITRDLPLNYVPRKGIDDAFVDNLTRDKHIVIYGSSKQGKTSLRKYCLKQDDYIIVQCSNKWSLSDLNSAILKHAGYEVTLSTKISVSGKNKVLAQFGGKILGTNINLGGEKESTKTQEIIKGPIELDIDDVNDIISALSELRFDKYILLEDFHYLPPEVQRDFSVALKAYHEKSRYCFIIIGVWLEENRLIVYNGDLTGRVISIDADKWTREQLQEVIATGGVLLNIQFTPSFQAALLDNCYDSVYIVQETCYQACKHEEVHETQPHLKIIGKPEMVDDIVKSVVDQQRGRFASFITQFADGFQETSLKMYQWLLYPILTADLKLLEKGLRLSDMRKSIQAKHPQGKDLNPGNLTQALISTASLQVKKGITPIILDYDQTNGRLRVVDRGFLIWLQHQDKQQLLQEAGLPTE